MAIEVLYHGNCFHEHKNPDIIDSIISKHHQRVGENPQLDLFTESSNNNDSNDSSFFSNYKW